MDKQESLFSKLNLEKIGVVNSSYKKAKVKCGLEVKRSSLGQFDYYVKIVGRMKLY